MNAIITQAASRAAAARILTTDDIGICLVPETQTEQQARQYLAYAQQYHPQAQRDYAETLARMELAKAIRSEFDRAEAIRRAAVPLEQATGVLETTTKWVARAELALAEIESGRIGL